MSIRSFILAGVLAASTIHSVQAISVVGCLEDAAGLPVNAQLTFTPVVASGLVQDGTNIVTVLPIVVTPTSGCFTQNFVPLNYWLTSDALKVPTFFSVPTNGTLVDWKTCMTNLLSYVPVTNGTINVTYNITTNTGSVTINTNNTFPTTYITNEVTVFTNGSGAVEGRMVYTNFLIGTTYRATNSCIVGYSFEMIVPAGVGNLADAGVYSFPPGQESNVVAVARLEAPQYGTGKWRGQVTIPVVSNGWYRFYTNGVGGVSTKANAMTGTGYIYFFTQ